MNFITAELIKKKRNSETHTSEEIRFLVDGFTSGRIPDYQMSAWLMAVYLNGMASKETYFLTDAMMKSGQCLDFSHFPGVPVDKHSTGGVGDKTSMIIAPIVAAAGVKVPMIAGRGLGHTGGTLDKLEAIPGFNVGLSLDQFTKQIEDIGTAIIGQTAEICPADKKIYALRDVTATVESLPLICASIMSKKLAEGIGALVLDVKYGTGAFMKTIEKAEELADKLLEIGRAHGKKAAALITNMDQPLGRFIGNSLEIEECIAILRGEPCRGRPLGEFADTQALSVELAGHMIWLSGAARSLEEGIDKANDTLASGKAWDQFEKICHAQGAVSLDLPQATKRLEILAEKDGFVGGFHAEKLGLAAITLGAGRLKTTDAIDHTAGIEMHLKMGDPVKKGAALFTLYTSLEPGAQRPEDCNALMRAKDIVLSATNISLQKPLVPDLIAKRRTI